MDRSTAIQLIRDIELRLAFAGVELDEPDIKEPAADEERGAAA
jgi:hypothetical protein